MTPADPDSFPGPPPSPASALVGASVIGRLDGPRAVVRWPDLLAAAQADETPPGLDGEGYLTAFAYPAGAYTAHVRRVGSPKGYAGPAAARYLWFDIDRAGDLDAARADAATLVRFLVARYPKLEPGVGVWFSGGKGFHVGLECLPGFDPSPAVPAICKRLAAGLAAAAGVRIDPAIYDPQRLLRLPNSTHPRTGLYKRPLRPEELDVLAARIADLARHPAGFDLPAAAEVSEELDRDWREAAALLRPAGSPSAPPGGPGPAVPKYVRDFIGFADVADPGRAVTLFRCAAALAEAGTPAAVVFGLLEEPAVKTGLPAAEVGRQIAAGIAHARPGGQP